jgi:ABC-type nickel/cobalt efflux system permease component RcnA
MALKRFAVAVAMVVLGMLLLSSPASAHPLGNFTVNTSANVRVGPHEIGVDHVVDFAEIPAYQASDDIDRLGEGDWAAQQCDAIAVAVDVRAAGEVVRLAVRDAAISFPPGQAGLSTLRLECSLVSGTIDSTASVSVTDHAFEDKTGWREITAVGDGTTLRVSDVPTESPSAVLTQYPTGAPLVVRSASVQSTAGGAAAPVRHEDAVSRLLPRGIDSASRSFTDLISRREVTVPFVLVALLAAAALGSLHALAPGHGKTVMAAYVIGRRGTTKQGLLIGATVALTHTAGVLALGIGLWVSEAIAPERLIPILGIVSGVLLAAIGTGLLRGALRRRGLTLGHHHEHDDEHGHHHDPAHHGHHHHHHHHHDDDHEHAHHDHVDEGLRRWSLVLLGLAGGLVPSPSALVVLIGALALGRAWLGVALVAAYGVGMACCLVGAGLLLARLGGAVERRMSGSRLAGVVFGRALPVGTASIVVVVGLTVAVRAAGQL